MLSRMSRAVNEVAPPEPGVRLRASQVNDRLGVVMWIKTVVGFCCSVICWSLLQPPGVQAIPEMPARRPLAPLPLANLGPLLAPAAVAPLPAPVSEPEPPASLPTFQAPTGERLTYRARVWKGFNFLGTDVGTVVFRIGEGLSDGAVTDVYEARAQGGGFGYEVAAHTVAEVRRRDGRPLRYEMLQQGSRTAGQRIIFEDEGAHVLKLKHCQGGPSCTESAHQVEHEVSTGWFRSRKVRGHCHDLECGQATHEVWRTRARIQVGATVRDMLSVIYYARSLRFTPQEPSHLVEVVQGRNVWKVQVSLVKSEFVEVPAGRFAANLIAITPVSQHDEKFEGLFGIKGSLKVWLDQASGQPVQVTGTIPFGVDLQGQVVLIDRGSELPEPRDD